MFSTVICSGKSGFFNSCARRRASSRHAATRSACTSRSRCAVSSAVMRLKACASWPISSPPATSTVVFKSPLATRPRALREPAHGPRDARRGPPGQRDADQNAARRDRDAGPQQRGFELHHLLPRAGDQQHAEHIVLIVGERHGAHVFDAGGADDLARAATRLFDQRAQRGGVAHGPLASISSAGTNSGARLR